MPYTRDVGDDEKALVKSFKARLESAKEDNKTLFAKFEKWRIEYEGYLKGDRKGDKVRTNLIFSTMQTVLPRVYAKNPDVSVTPGESVSDDQYGIYKDFCGTCETMLDKVFVRGAKIKRRAKATVRSSMVTSVGWAKVVLQKEWAQDPVILQRLNDAQENVKNIDAYLAKIRGEGDDCTKDEAKARLKLEMESLGKQVEVVKRKGIVTDKLHSEDVIILDDAVQDFDQYQEARAIAQRIWMNQDEFLARFKFTAEESAKAGYGSPTTYDQPRGTANKPVSVPATNSQPGKPATYGGAGSESKKKWYQVFEIWDHESNHVLTWAEGMESWAKEPFIPVTGDHWYSFFPLVFNVVDGSFYGLSDVELLSQLQEEYNNTRDDFARHRAENLPVRVIREGGNLTPGDVGKVVNRESGDFIVISGGGGQPLSYDMQVMENPPIDPLNYDTIPIRTDIELISGSSDAANGAVQRAKTATEASYLQEGLASRTSERQDAVEDWFSDMCVYALQIMLQEWSKEDVTAIAGDDAVWPQMDKQVVFDKINVEVRGGSSGKPNSINEREQWTQLMPVLKDSMQQVSELRASGQQDLADALVEMLKETFRRFDERIDIDAFFPRGKEGDPAAQLQQCQQELMQCKQQLQMLTEEYQKVSKGEYSKVAAEQTKQANEVTKQQEFAAKGAMEQTRQMEASNKLELEKYNVDSQERMAKYKIDRDVDAKMYAADVDSKAKVEIALGEAAHTANLEREKIASNERVALSDHSTKNMIAERDAQSKEALADKDAETKLALGKQDGETKLKVADSATKARGDQKAKADDGMKQLISSMADVVKAVNEGNAKNSKAIADGLAKVAEAAMSERELVMDDKGEPVRSRVVMH